MRGRLKVILGKFLLLMIGGSIGLLLIEIMLRLILPGPPLKAYNVDVRGVHQVSEIPELVYELKPGAERVVKAADHAASYRINSSGLRDYEYPIQKNNRVFRIVVLGDSVTFGHGVELDQAYHKILERMLNLGLKIRLRYEVLNFGVSGYNVAMEAIVLREKALRYKPDLVIVGFNLNDGDPPPKLEEILEGRGSKTSGRIPLPGKAWLQEHSYLYGIVAIGGTEVFLRLGVWKRELMYGLTANLFESITEPRRETESWRKVSDGLIQVLELSRKVNAKVVLVAFPLQVQMDYDPRRPPMGNLTLQDLRRPQEKLREFAAEKGIAFVDLLPVYNSLRTKNRPLFVNDVTSHPDEKGHRIAAEEIYKILVSDCLIPNAGK